MSRRAKIGRPPSLDMRTSMLFLSNFRWSGSVASAARACGVHRVTCWRWLARGRAGLEPYSGFVALVDELRRLHPPSRPRRVPRRQAAGVQSICTGPDPTGG